MLEKIIRNIVEVIEDPEVVNNIKEDSDLIHDIGLDSLQLINLIVAIEEEFNIEIEFDEFDFEEVSTVKKLLAYVEAKVYEKK
ncbi:phosphopantetheine-binding protein [Clostridium beijerinckii]|uniref:phosphopantetheine-binding protein n=1 Tax=Clostridium beijerinckii TaxID=1520 RepID=UPI001493E46B|nr:phosphopantetheine-binding protein [Clostridium beijerinckii]NOW06642.1 acyl carrier protein [Clostridium beijerinckii]NYC00214.1 acyl carrier protein [Clostridium beijerinckii]